jgi:hypothetical protein
MAKLKTLIKTGFGLGIGLIGAQILFLLIGLVFFIPGFLMYNKEKKNDNESGKIGGVILMGIGVLIMGGLGFGFLMNAIGDTFD